MVRFLRALLIPIVIVAALNWRTIVTIARLKLLPPPTVTAQTAAQAVEEQPNNSLQIPSLGLQVPVIPSQTDPTSVADWNILKQDLTRGVSLAEKLPKPGELGTTVVTGHSSDWVPHRYAAVFATLNDLPADGEIALKYDDKLYTYKVETKQVVDPNNLQFFNQLTADKTKSRLALVTCWPLLTTSRRLVVTATLQS